MVSDCWMRYHTASSSRQLNSHQRGDAVGLRREVIAKTSWRVRNSESQRFGSEKNNLCNVELSTSPWGFITADSTKTLNKYIFRLFLCCLKDTTLTHSLKVLGFCWLIGKAMESTGASKWKCIRRKWELGKQHGVCTLYVWSYADLAKIWGKYSESGKVCWLKRELNDTALYFPLSSIFGLYLQINTNFLISTQTRQLSLKQKNDSKLGLNLIKRMSYCDYLDRYCIYNMKANGHFCI